MGRGPKPAKGKAKPAVPRKSQDNDGSRVRDLEKRLAEALEQQTATTDILGIISRFPADAQPVFDAIALNAFRLCDADGVAVARYDGALLHLAAHHNIDREAVARLEHQYPQAPRRDYPVGQAILDGVVVQVPDLQAAVEFSGSVARQFGGGSQVAIPLLHQGRVVGGIGISRRKRGPFSDNQIALLKTFAAQAVIAIENVRLFTELEGRNRDLSTALDQRTATAEILRVISSSPTNVQPTFEAIAESATRLCGAVNGLVFLFDGELIHAVAHHNIGSAELDAILSVFPIRPGRGSVAGRAIERLRIVHVEDLAQDPEYEQTRVVQAGFRTALSVPMLRGGVPIGAINVMRMAVAPFSPSQVALLQTFADQAVIAIENVRLFKELELRNTELTDTLARQTATAEVLSAISRAQTDAQPVFEFIAASAFRLCSAEYGSIQLYDGKLLHLVAAENANPQGTAALHQAFPRQPGEGGVGGRVIRTGAVVEIPDILDDPAYELKNEIRAMNLRGLLAVPMVKNRQPIGAIIVGRAEPGPFSTSQIELLKTFADQAVIAIENVRLFKELEAANRELAAASQHKSEFLANMSHELRTPLNAIIGFSEVLSERMFGELNEKQEEYSKDIHASGEHLLSLINDILDLSKIEAGRMELELTDFDLPTAIDNALMLIRERAGRRSIALHTDIDGRLGQVQADERKVRQVVLNLLSNAIKFTPEGGRIEVGALPKDGFVEISVSDTGIGIAPEDQEKVFEEFRQVGTAAKKIEGTGLGLTLCRKFVELHGGKISVKSELGAGSTFTFTIPMASR